MARIRPIKNKENQIISYEIRVFRGKDVNGKELKPYTITWKVPSTYKSEKAIQAALQKEVGHFETLCRQGSISTDKRTFEEYSIYFMKLKSRDCKAQSINFYNRLFPRINEEIGNIKLSSLTTEHLNRFYMKLYSPDVRQDKKAIAKDKLLCLKQELHITHSKLEELSDLSENTIRLACQQKKIAVSSANKISNALGKKTDELFNIIVGGNGKGLSEKYIMHYHNLIHDILELAYTEGVVSKNVANMAKPPKIKRHEAEYFEIEDILKVRNALASVPLKYKIMVYLLIETGCRRGELFGIRWKSINFKENTITIDNNIQYNKEKCLFAETPKNSEIRTISIASEITQVLKSYKKLQQEYQISLGIPDYNPDGYLFTQECGNVMNPSSLNHWMTNFEKNYNLPHIYPHKFRHSQASILYASNVDVVTISKRLGHKQVSTTQNIYAHLMKESDRKASNAIANVLYRGHA